MQHIKKKNASTTKSGSLLWKKEKNAATTMKPARLPCLNKWRGEKKKPAPALFANGIPEEASPEKGERQNGRA